MFPAQRRAMILDHVRQQGDVSVQSLARQLRVSLSTIRRDLNLLAGQGALIRVRGGVSADPHPQVLPQVPSATESARAAIGRKAAALVEDKQVVLLDIGTTVAMVARHLFNRPVTVVTSSLAVADELRDSSATELILLGGVYRPSYLSFVGPLTQSSLAHLSADIAFLGASGIRRDLTVLDTAGTEAPIKQAILERSSKKVLLATGDKFPGAGLVPVCSTTDFDTLITSGSPQNPTIEKIQETSTEVLFA